MLDKNNNGWIVCSLSSMVVEKSMNTVVKFCNNFKIFGSHVHAILSLSMNFESIQTITLVIYLDYLKDYQCGSGCLYQK